YSAIALRKNGVGVVPRGTQGAILHDGDVARRAAGISRVAVIKDRASIAAAAVACQAAAIGDGLRDDAIGAVSGGLQNARIFQDDVATCGGKGGFRCLEKTMPACRERTVCRVARYAAATADGLQHNAV